MRNVSGSVRPEVSGTPPHPRPQPSVRSSSTVVLAALLALASFAALWDLSSRVNNGDYYQFWVVGQAVQAHETDDIYSAAERQRLGQLYWQRAVDEAKRLGLSGGTKRVQSAQMRKELETYSTPFLYSLVGTLSTGGYDRDQDTFQRVSSAWFAAGLFSIAWTLGFGLAGSFLAVALASALSFGPVADDVFVGNVNRLQLGALAVVLGLLGVARSPMRVVAAGAVLSILLLFKPNLALVPAILVVGWSLDRRYRELMLLALGAVLGASLVILHSTLFFGSVEPWSAWLREVPKLMEQGTSAEGNYALRPLLRGSMGSWASSLATAVSVGGLLATVVFGRRGIGSAKGADISPDGSLPTLRLLALGAMASVLLTDLVWFHYYVLALPLALCLLRPNSLHFTEARPALRAVAAVSVVFIALQPVAQLLHPRDPALAPWLVSGGAATLFVLGVVDAVLGRTTDPVGVG